MLDTDVDVQKDCAFADGATGGKAKFCQTAADW